MSDAQTSDSIKPIDRASVHRITSGQVVTDLQTAVKELVENSLDAGATNIEVRFKDHGVKSLEVIDNGSGISKENYEGLALKHHTSKLANFEDLTIVRSFGFRGEALSSICALSESVVFTTATASEAPMGTVLEMERSGKLKSSEGKVARQRGTTATVTGLFAPLPVRRKEFERNAKREFGKALNLLHAYALVPCVQENQGVRLTVFNQVGSGKKTSALQTDGSRSLKSSVSSLWGPKQVENLVPLDLRCVVQTEKASLKRQGISEEQTTEIRVTGLISKFSPGNGRTSPDRQFFYVNGRPCNLTKIQKAFNEVYRSFNTNQSPFVIADFQLPTSSCDINVSPDKRTIFIHSEGNLILALKEALEEAFSPARSTYRVQESNSQKQSSRRPSNSKPTVIDEEEEIDPLAGSENQEPEPGSLNQKPSPVDNILSASTRSVPEPPQDSERSQTSGESNICTVVVERTPSKKPLFRTSPEPENTTGPSSRPSHSSSKTHPPLTQLSRNATTDTNEPSPEPTAEFLHVVSPVGTKRTYTSAAASRAAVASDIGAGRDRPVQTVLSTMGASWNLRRGREPTSPESRKKPRTSKDLVQKTLDFKTRLTSFALPGSQIDRQPSEGSSARSEEIDQEIEMVEVEEVDRADEDMTIPEEMPQERSAEALAISVKRRRVMSPDAEPAERSEPPAQASIRRRGSPARNEISVDPVDTEIAKSPKETPVDLSTDVVSIDTDKGVKQTVNRSDARRVKVELERLSTIWARVGAMPSGQSAGPSTVISNAASVTNVDSQQKAEEELSRVISKVDFESMEVVGQFNKGFIVARLRKAPEGGTGSLATTTIDDLFLIDQHASDEKYNFETLQATTKIQSQQLIQPRLLELSAVDEIMAMENMEMLRKNGFEIALKPTASGGRERVHLVAQPISKNTVFDFRGERSD
ncbi:hypothetical protein FRC04_009824 [Tulasnella sp. 424]|nr:hypothetical protein FRC04_009824 [Tulasnella sp. 424]KAG8972892.1 hypothetical protein FRC05_009446 [Tulasnella sp. 425]